MKLSSQMEVIMSNRYTLIAVALIVAALTIPAASCSDRALTRVAMGYTAAPKETDEAPMLPEVLVTAERDEGIMFPEVVVTAERPGPADTGLRQPAGPDDRQNPSQMIPRTAGVRGGLDGGKFRAN
jgi:hypothetical protein